MADCSAKIAQLREVVQIINNTASTIEQEWRAASTELPQKKTDGFELANPVLYEAQRTMIAATGSIQELVWEPHARLIDIAGQYWTTTALTIAAKYRIADLLDGHDENGLDVMELALKTGIDPSKLERTLRALSAEHIFTQVQPTRFANNSTSKVMIRNELFRGYILIFHEPGQKTAENFPDFLLGPHGASLKANETSFNAAVNTQLPFLEWLYKPIPKSISDSDSPGDNPTGATTSSQDLTLRREAGIFAQAMQSTGRLRGTGLVYDYPWDKLGKATVVDVGANIGAMCLALAAVYPDLNFVIQDLENPLKAAPKTWQQANKAALDAGKVKFQVHDFFTEQPVKGAEVYLFRYIIHDWSDEYCVTILSQTAAAMAPNSRILICDQVMVPSCGSADTVNAPKPLLANYGIANRTMNHMDMLMMGLLNSNERTPEQFQVIIKRAGLKLVKIWDCRSTLSIIECQLA